MDRIMRINRQDWEDLVTALMLSLRQPPGMDGEARRKALLWRMLDEERASWQK